MSRISVIFIRPFSPPSADISNYYTELPTATHTPPCTCDTQRVTRIVPSYSAQRHSAARTGALDKALDIWYTIGVGLKKNTNRSTMTITIKLKPNDRVERAMTKLKNIVIKEGLYKELKDRRYYAKPSLKRKLKREEAARQRIKDQHKDIRAALRDEENFLL